MKNPLQWLMDDWKREKVTLYAVVLTLLVAELAQVVILMGVYLKL